MSDKDKTKQQPTSDLEELRLWDAATEGAEAERNRSTERKEAAESLQGVRDEVQAIYDGMTDGLLIADVETKRFVRANPAICSMLGYSENELLSLSVMDIHPKEDLPEVLHAFQEQVAERRRIAENLPVLRKDGSVLYADVAPSLLIYQNRPCMIGIFRDTTERREAQEHLRKVTERLSLATGAANVGIWDLDVSNNNLVWDNSMFRLYGITPNEFGGAFEAWRAGVHSEDLPRVEAELQLALRGEKEFDTDFRVVWPDRSVHWVTAKAMVRHDALGRPVRMLGTNWDITQRKETEQSLRSNLEIQSVLAALLRLSLEPLLLEELLRRTLDLLFLLPWIQLESKGSIFLVEDDPQVLVMKAAQGLTEPLLTGCHRVPLGRCLCGKAAAHRQVVFANCVDEQHVTHYPDMTPHGHYCIPIVSENALLGVVNLYAKEGHQRKPAEESFLAAVADVLAGMVKRRQTEKSLSKSEERFDLAVRGTDAGIWDWDLLTDEVYFSPRWKSILGYEESEIRNHFSEWEARLHPDDRERALTTVRNYLDGRSFEYELEHRLQHKDGSYRWILARGAVVRDPSGKAYRMAGSHLDITERKRSEQLMLRREGELVAAQRVQEQILPRSAPGVPGYDIAATLLPAEFAAGDYYDYLSMPDGSLGIVVGDVSGHSVSASLLMAATSAHLRSFVVDHSDIREIVRHVNALLCQETEEAKFVTLVFVQIDLVCRTLKYLNLAHPSGYVLGQSGEPRSVLRSGVLPLGIMPDLELPEVSLIRLEPNDIVLLATDGILEAQSPEGTPFGTERMLEVVRANRERRASEIVQSLQQAIFDFTRQRKPQDDLTAVVIKVGAN